MDIITTARRFELTPDVREHAEKRLQKLERYFDHIQEIHLILAQEKHRQIAEVAVHANGTELISRQETHDMLASIDQVVDRLERQLKKYNARLKDRKSRRPVAAGHLVEESDLSEVEVEEEFSPVVVREQGWHADGPLTVEEAIRMLRDSDRDHLMFRNGKTAKVTMVHLRPDGNFGIIESD